MEGRVRVRNVDGIVIAFFASKVRLSGELKLWYEALERPGVRAAMCLGVGPIRSEPQTRRRTVELLRRLQLPIAVVSDNRLNHGLVRVFGYLGVPMGIYRWCELDEASRSLASRPRYTKEVSQAALELCGDERGQTRSGVLRS